MNDPIVLASVVHIINLPLTRLLAFIAISFIAGLLIGLLF